MHELLTYRLAIDDWEFDQKSSSLNHLLDWNPKLQRLFSHKKEEVRKSVTPFYNWQEQTFQDALRLWPSWGLEAWNRLKMRLLSSTEQPLSFKRQVHYTKATTRNMNLWRASKEDLEIPTDVVEKIIMWTVVDSIINGSLRSSSTFLRRAKCVCSILNNMFLPHKSTLKVSSASRLPYPAALHSTLDDILIM